MAEIDEEDKFLQCLEEEKKSKTVDKKIIEKASADYKKFTQSLTMKGHKIDFNQPVSKDWLKNYPDIEKFITKLGKKNNEKATIMKDFLKTKISDAVPIHTVPEPTPDYDDDDKKVKDKKSRKPQRRLQMTITKRDLKQRPRLAFDEQIKVSREHYDRLVETEKLQRAKLEELTTRLSSLASKQLTEGNPNITDLSDRNRPIKIGEMFGEMYDDEWSDAFEELQCQKYSDDVAMQLLLDIVMMAYKFCSEVASSQMTELIQGIERVIKYPVWTSTKTDKVYQVDHTDVDVMSLSSVSKHAKECRKAAALGTVPALCTMFKDGMFKETKPSMDLKSFVKLEIYIDKVVELTWLMNVQDPPMRLEIPEAGEKIDFKLYRNFLQKGDIVDKVIWPVVLLNSDKMVISKGYVLPIASAT